MPSEEKKTSILEQTQSVTKAAQTLHGLSKKRKELISVLQQKEKDVNYSVTKSLNEMREKERKKRIEIYGEKEEQRQQITSAVMLELMQICKQDDVPRYILFLAKVLDNYQGKRKLMLFQIN